MTRHFRLALLLAVMGILLLLLAPALGAHAARPATHTHATVHVTIQNFAFGPQTITVAPGTTVVWTNKDSVAHTVTSDTGAWPDSGNLATAQTFSHTFAKAGTYPYHCAIHPSMTAKVTVGSGGMSGGSMTGGGMMGAMGPMSMRSMRIWTGYYDNHKVLYTWTDSSNKAEAMSAHINYAPSLAKALEYSVAMYMVMNGKFASRGPVFASEPGEDNYTPLWQEVFVTWKNSAKAVALGRDDQINDLAKKGMLTLKMTKTVVNCSIVKVMAGSMSGSSSGSGY
jgi:plastocyanin